MPRFGTPFRNAFAARLRRKPEGFFRKSEGFFRRALGSYTHKFPKRGAASLMYLPRSRLDLSRSRLGLPPLCLSRNSGPATEGFRIAASILKTHTIPLLITNHATVLMMGQWKPNGPFSVNIMLAFWGTVLSCINTLPSKKLVYIILIVCSMQSTEKGPFLHARCVFLPNFQGTSIVERVY